MAITTSGLIPMLFALVGVMMTLRYLKGVSDLSGSIRCLFVGMGFVFLSKLLIFGVGVLGETYYYLISLLCRLLSAVFITACACGIKGIKINPTALIVSVLLSIGWSWYVVVLTGDGSAMTLSLALSTLGYAALAAALWRRKGLRNTLGFVVTGWVCIFLVVYNIVGLMTWGQSLLSPVFETFLYIAFMCGLLLISNNMMAHQFDALMKEIKDNKERLRLMVQLSPFPIIISRLKGDQLILMNESAAKLFRLDKKNIAGFKMVDYFAEPSKRAELLAKLEKHPVVDDFEFMVKPRQGEPFWLLLSARVFDYEYDVALYMAFQDITDRKKKELQLFDQATRDPLTKCYNRRQFEELAKKEVQRSRRYNHPFCLFMIDADHFKNVNDTHGHAVGDLVLQALADCCRRTLRESDIVARFGGEEFVILLPEASIENAHRVAERLRIKISKLVVKNEQNQDVQFTVSIGLVSSTVTDNIAEMLKMSDEALYEAKEHGRNQVVVYDENGPNRSIPVPDGEDIEKVKNEPLYYFTPANAPAVRNQEEEPQETGVVGLDGTAVSQKYEELDNDEDEAGQTGVALNSLYEEDDSDETFTPAAQTVNQSADEPEPPYAGDLNAENELEPDLPEPVEIPAVFDDEEENGESQSFESALPPVLAEEPDNQTVLAPEPPPVSDEEPMSDDEIDSLLQDALPPDVKDTVVLPVSAEDETMPPPPVPVGGSVETSVSMRAVPHKTVMVKKIPVKMPAGMVKVPKMPGVVRVKIPKALHQAPIPPKPQN
ncbi:MAG TPA: hypothetical protein DD624_00325 [Alphaproteobacteria bacterium]|nr:hypothetical protein [Alphaproteobacteria bacterium]